MLREARGSSEIWLGWTGPRQFTRGKAVKQWGVIAEHATSEMTGDRFQDSDSLPAAHFTTKGIQ